jgi:alpha,alpha-trehalase
MSNWLFTYDGFDPKEERLREALCTLGNGYFATRGAGTETKADGIHYPGTYLAGGYNRLKTQMAGETIENEDLVNLPNWLSLNFRIKDGAWFNLQDVEILSYHQELDLKKGLLTRNIRFKDKKGHVTRIEDQRLVHMGNRHIAALKMTVHPENWSGKIHFRSALDGQVINDGVDRYRDLNNKHLEPLSTHAEEQSIHLKVQINQSKIQIAQSAKTLLFIDGKLHSTPRYTIEKPGYIAHDMEVDIEKDHLLSIEKIITLYTSKDNAISECALDARKELQLAGNFHELLQSHMVAWEHLWSHFQIELEIHKVHEEDRQVLILNLYTFHLLQTTSLHSMDIDVGVPSRGWHGEAYRGHIFWDELFIFPLLNLRIPEITRALLMYRYRRLGKAREAAKKEGYKGAMYPWQSGSNGREESQRIHLNPRSGRWIPDNSHLQRHVNSAIAYNIWQYYQVTNDMEFLSFYGAEMILEIARFWGSIVSYNSNEERYEILGVMGPDEYHDSYPDADKPGLNNNAYTNIMAVWVMERALELLNILAKDIHNDICKKIKLDQKEIDHWEDITRKMKVPIHGDGLISQFEGYDKLQEFDWKGYKKKYGDIQRLDRILKGENDTTNRYKVSKQADVLMLFYLFTAEELGRIFRKLGYTFEYETIPKNIEYYLNRTSHGSTLSRVVHSWVLARSDRQRSWKLFNEALQSDVADIQGGTTPEGIHLGAMAGTVDLIQRCYTGMDPRGDVLWFNPQLMDNLRKMNMLIRYRSHNLRLHFSPHMLKITSKKVNVNPIKIGFKDKVFDLQPKESKEFKL